MKLIRNVMETWKHLFLPSLEKVRRIILEVANYYNHTNVVESDKFRTVFRELSSGDMAFPILFRKVTKTACSHHTHKRVGISGKLLQFFLTLWNNFFVEQKKQLTAHEKNKQVTLLAYANWLLSCIVHGRWWHFC